MGMEVGVLLGFEVSEDVGTLVDECVGIKQYP